MKLPIPNDMTRCHGLQCGKWLTCARHQTMEVDALGQYSYAQELCLPVDGKQQDFYIEVTE
jgi:hypothetical protein